MKKNFKIILMVVLSAIGLYSFIPKTQNAGDPEKDKMLLELLTYVIEKGHYNPRNIDDAFSKDVYREYLKSLDGSKRFFLQSDIDEFSKYEDKIDDAIKNKDLTFFDLTYSRLMQRIEESKTYYGDFLSNPIDYSIDENYSVDYDKSLYAKNVTELKDRWRKLTKLSTLSSLVDKVKLQEDYKKVASEILTGKPTEKQKAEYAKKKKEALENPKTLVDFEKETRESAKKSLDEYYTFAKDIQRKDYFSIFINAIVERFDPHTSYFAPEEKERFDVSISGKLEGIGARLQKKNDFTEISELISGGPAWRGKQLESGDLVLKVAQGDAEPVDVVGMRLDDVVKKIKGPKGTEVRLTIKKTDGSIKVISIIRDQVEIEETYVKSSVVEKNSVKYGVIYLPKFYIDFENRDGRDAGKDIAIELERLKKENVKGIVFDVRDDGGGSLETVRVIAGLFIEKGPIVQIKTAGGSKEVQEDTDERVQWDGSLVVMVNSFSASASEILAAAIQDYKRGVILGSKQTYGKGTVQNVIDLNRFMRNSDYGDLGAIKTTTQKFYRINGGSTQLEGVSSDVVMADRYAYLKMGERDEPNALKWDKIDPANYTPWSKAGLIDLAIANSKKRIESYPQMKLIDESAKWLDQRNKEYNYSLNIEKYKLEQKKLEDSNKKFKSILDYNNKLKFTALPYEIELMQKDSALKEKRESWYESLSKDIYVEEAVKVLEDLNGGASKKSVTSVKVKKTLKV